MTTAAQTTPRHRLRAVLGAAVLGTTLLGGCAVFNPQQTDYAYQAADGVNVTFGDLDVRGLAVIADTKGAPGVLIGQLVNTSDDDLDVSLASEGSQPTQVTVPRHGSLSLGEDGESVTLSSVSAAPGDVLNVQVSTAATGQNIATVPVLPALGYYKDMTPAPAASPSASASASG
ncbi:hypothetical protein GCM10022415_07530 [Knoellia locipacati]|uniref:Uncharacterized protein n=1 Tax=Knoellia locipacati TaxID=882824 RepID=A0A512SXR4_9MICO|nr:hypothetical protein [Knoellia locipacati]GEQ12704.1 hypothetical protein KLO01_07510 [Knoellia locipacati]